MRLKSLIDKSPYAAYIFKNGAYIFISKIISILMVYAFHLYISRSYGSHVNGVFTLFITLLTIFSVVSKLGFDTSIVKYISSFRVKDQYQKIKSIHYGISLLVFIFSLLISLFLFVFNDFLSLLFIDDYNTVDFVWMAVALPFYALLSINTESLRGLEKTKSYAFFQNGSVFIITILLVVLMSSVIENPSTLVVISFSIAVILLYGASYFTLNTFFDSNKTKEKLNIKPYLKESLPMLLSNSIFFIMTWADVLMISYFLPESETGIYGNASKIANLNVVFLFAINAIAAPRLAAYNTTKNHTDLKNFTKETSRISLFMSIPILLVILMFPSKLLGLFGEEFTVGTTALIILAIGQFVNAASGSVINVLNMADKQAVAKNIILFAAILNVVLNYFLIPIYGILGAAISTCASTILWNLLGVIYVYKHFNFISITLPWQKL
jgi:O-antigen/teichoic acid export membrane protein